MEWARIGGVAAVGLTALLILRAYKPEWAPFLRMAVTAVALGLTVGLAATVLEYVTELAGATGVMAEEGWVILLKSLGVAAGKEDWLRGWRRRGDWSCSCCPFPSSAPSWTP